MLHLLQSNNFIEKISDKIVNMIKGSQLSEKDKEARWYYFIKRTAPQEKRFAGELTKLFRDQEGVVLANLKKTPKSLVKGGSEDLINHWLPPRRQWELKFQVIGEPFISQAVKTTGEDELARLITGVSFDMENPRVQNFIKKHTFKFSFEVNDTTIKLLKKEFKEGLAAGEGIPDLRKRVQKVFGFSEKYRNTRIARTEIIRASNSGAEEAYRQSGVVEGKEWLAEIDPRCCPQCEAMNGRTAGLGKSFNITDIDLNFDYTEGEMPYPPLHVQCRCTLLPIVR